MAYTYDVIVIGGGAAGLTASGISANFGAKTLLIDRERLGGDCTWTGCVPSKTLLKAAKIARHIRHAGQYGLIDQPVDLDFARLMEHLRDVRQDVYHDADRPEIYEAMGIEVRFGEARFVDPHTIDLATGDGPEPARLSARYFIIAAGARASVPPIDGLAGVPYLTNDTLFEPPPQGGIGTLPNRLAIVGGGPIGTEMAQAFRRFGSEVTVIDRGGSILKKDDPELSGMLQDILTGEGIRYVFNAGVKRVSKADDGVSIEVEVDGEPRTVAADALLMATGRGPNLEALNLEAAGIEFTPKGITVDDRCRTNHRHIYAVGDITGRYQFTHMSEHMAKVAATNALLKLPLRIDTKHVPWVTYTDPELGHVGATEAALKEAGTSYQVYRFPYTKIDRAITEGETEGLIKVYAKKWNGKILGADVLGVNAGELISEYAVAMKNGVTLRALADTIHPYPTYGLGARRAADQWYVQKQSATLVKLLKTVFRYRGPVNEYVPGTVV